MRKNVDNEEEKLMRDNYKKVLLSLSHATDVGALKIDVEDHHLYRYHPNSYQLMCLLLTNLLSNRFDMLYNGLKIELYLEFSY